jgi:hypothetical protein
VAGRPARLLLVSTLLSILTGVALERGAVCAAQTEPVKLSLLSGTGERVASARVLRLDYPDSQIVLTRSDPRQTWMVRGDQIELLRSSLLWSMPPHRILRAAGNHRTDGALLGAVGGVLVVGVAYGLHARSEEGSDSFAGDELKTLFLGIPTALVVGAISGSLIGRRLTKYEVVYDRPRSE